MSHVLTLWGLQRLVATAVDHTAAFIVLIGIVLTGAGCDRSAPELKKQSSRRTDIPADRLSPSAPDDLTIAKQLVSKQDFDAAEAVLRNRLLRNAVDADAYELLGDIANQRGDEPLSLSMYRESRLGTPTPSQILLQKLAHAYLRASLVFDSLEVLQELTLRYPDYIQARYELAGLATSIGLPRLAVPSLQWLAQHGQGDAESLIVLADPDLVEPDEELCRKVLARVPEDLRIHYSLARFDAGQLRWREVVQRLEPVVTKLKDFVPAYTLYGRALIELGEDESLVQWSQSRPQGVDQSPAYWLVSGLWAQRQGRHSEAARAFWECLQLEEPGPPEVLNSLILSLNQVDRQQEANKVAQQIFRYSQLRDAIKTHFERDAKSQRTAMGVGVLMTDLGRIWEGEAWARLAISLPEDRIGDAREQYLAIRARLAVDSPWQLPEAKLASQMNLESLPLVSWATPPVIQPEIALGESGRLFFKDEANARGLKHTCAISPAAKTAGHWIYQSLGGGVGVIDFDLDGWPDVAAAMLDGRPLEMDSSPNRLFRNRKGTFVESGLEAGYQDTGFSQGITVGDFNEDGFPDLFDSNIGQNRLYRNNGDGTFKEVAAGAGLSSMVWTTSAAIVDIDGDGFSDLYETNYCRGPEPYQHPCRNQKGQISTCPPLKFEPESDRVWRGVGDGTFVDVSQSWMDQTSLGRGLGVVVGAFDERRGLDLYVANDMSVNHLWSATPLADRFGLTEIGAIRGVGLSGRSTSQASMGIAVGDPDNDGDTDFFLTHFADDHNTYYEQVSPGFWSDRSAVVGLAAPSIKLLGFGTQWCDFDNNGSLELIIANGHVDDVDRVDVSYYMPAQLFERNVDGHWNEYEQELGEYFRTNHLGRALATLDVNRDGRMDVAITHLYDPVSLLTNHTQDSGSRITFLLKSTRGARDAIGASVTVTMEQRKVWAQLTAGDGYMCSNERQISFGTGATSTVKDVTVNWPSGVVENFGSLQSNQNHLLIEGAGQAFQMDKPP